MCTYLNFIKEKGNSFSKMSFESNEFALKIDDTLEALKILKDNKVAVLGGDILTEDNQHLVYAYQVWGDEYQYLNWYCDKSDDENVAEYLQRSHICAKESIIKANKIAENLQMKCYINLVI